MTTDKKRFQKIMITFGEMFEKELSPGLIETYWLSLQNYGIDNIEKAAVCLIKTSRFMPKPIEFIEMLQGTSSEIKLSIELRALAQWNKTIDSLNPYDSIVFEDAATAQAVRSLGGWNIICNMGSNEIRFFKRDFIQSYIIAAQNPYCTSAERYSGIIESGNPPGVEFPQIIIRAEKEIARQLTGKSGLKLLK